MDYSYKYFYNDGYGKDYRIYNLQNTIDAEQRHLYLVGYLLSFYQQMKLFETKADELRTERYHRQQRGIRIRISVPQYQRT